MILELKHIFKEYNPDKLVVPVLKDISLAVDEGEYGAFRFRQNDADEYYRLS